MTYVKAEIRAARDDEAPVLYGIAHDGIGAGFEGDRTQTVLRSNEVYVADVEGVHAGYVAVRQEGDDLLVEQLFVATAVQGEHVGHQLLDWVEGLGCSRRLRRVAIESSGDDARSAAFYARRGYLVEGDRMVRVLPGLTP